MYQKTPVSRRQFRTKCGGHLMTMHPPPGLMKFKDFPAEFGGSGEIAAE